MPRNLARLCRNGRACIHGLGCIYRHNLEDNNIRWWTYIILVLYQERETRRENRQIFAVYYRVAQVMREEVLSENVVTQPGVETHIRNSLQAIHDQYHESFNIAPRVRRRNIIQTALLHWNRHDPLLQESIRTSVRNLNVAPSQQLINSMRNLRVLEQTRRAGRFNGPRTLRVQELVEDIGREDNAYAHTFQAENAPSVPSQVLENADSIAIYELLEESRSEREEQNDNQNLVSFIINPPEHDAISGVGVRRLSRRYQRIEELERLNAERIYRENQKRINATG
jgi:hypothetical protein